MSFYDFEPYIFLIVCDFESHDATMREKDSWNIAINGWKCYCNYGLAFSIRHHVGMNVVVFLLMGNHGDSRSS